MTGTKKPSTGDAISTFTFVLFAILLALASLQETGFKGAALAVCSMLSLIAALRFKIQRLIDQLRR